ncbi:MAG: hypothetical protein ACKV2Q_14730 [Planctomycetaceae bacterium]
MNSWILAGVAYCVTVALTLWLLHRHLLKMRAEVQPLVTTAITEFVSQGKQKAKTSACDLAGRAVHTVQSTVEAVLAKDASEVENGHRHPLDPFVWFSVLTGRHK